MFDDILILPGRRDEDGDGEPADEQPGEPQTAGGADKPELNERVGIVEAILFVTGNAVEKSEICRAMNSRRRSWRRRSTRWRAGMITTAGG